MNIVKNDFAIALQQVAKERGISTTEVIESIEAAVLAAYHKQYGGDPEAPLVAKVNKDTGETHILDENGKDITPPGFGRIAAQTARNVVVQKIREAERRTVLDQFQQQIGTLLKARVIRVDGPVVIVDVNHTEAVLPKSEQMKGEEYMPGVPLTVVLKLIEVDKFGRSRIIVSRAAPELLTALFKREVPEIANGTVEIKAIARDAGERSKIAVHSLKGGIDPVGACVGQKGVRVQVVTDELMHLEKVDIIQWLPDEKLFLMSALAPAKIESVELDTKAKRAKVTVQVSQASLAIGKGGVNVNLASQLTGYSVDIIQIPDTTPAVTTSAESVAPATPKASVEAEETAPAAETPVEAPVSATSEGDAPPSTSVEKKDVAAEPAA